MDTQQLKTFLTIAEIGNFTKAAEQLDYAQSSVSAQIKSLEDELDTRLFERTGRNMSLTDSGRRFITYAQQFLKLVEEAKQSVSISSEPQGTLTIGAPETLCVFRLPSVLATFRNRFPKVKLILKQGSCQDLYNWTQQNSIDIAFVLDPPGHAHELVVEALRQEPMTLIAGKSHANLAEGIDVARLLEGVDLILIDEGGCCYRTLFEQQLKSEDIQLGSIQEFGSVEMIKKFVASGLGVSLLPTVTVEEEIKNGLLTDLHWDTSTYNIHTWMLLHKEKWHSPALTAFIDIVREHLTEHETC